MRTFDTKQLTLAAVLAAVYAALTLCLPSYTPIQIRLSEALTVLPFLFPAATPGVIVGCFVANLLSPYGAIDVVCGTLATALAKAGRVFSGAASLAPRCAKIETSGIMQSPPRGAAAGRLRQNAAGGGGGPGVFVLLL